MIAETSIPLFVLCTSSLTAAFAYYNTKYRKFMKENAGSLTKTQTEQGEMTKQKIRLQKPIQGTPQFFREDNLSPPFFNQKYGLPQSGLGNVTLLISVFSAKLISFRQHFMLSGAMAEITDRKFTVILRAETEGGYSAQCVELPRAISQGESRKEALANIKEAVKGYLEAFPEELKQLKQKRELVQITI
jgi:predicted RNase H-like HicB family nuclease